MLDSELEQLIEGLPGTLEQLLDRQARQRPPVVQPLIERAEAMRAEGDGRCYYVADAARLLAAELPEEVELELRFALRARSLELWGTMLRLAGDMVRAEAALLCAFELLAQNEGAEARDLVVILGRCALVASDAEQDDDLARYAAEAVRVTRVADREWPLPAFLYLWKTTMADPKSIDSAIRLAKALFAAVSEAYDDFADCEWRMGLEITDHGEGRTEIKLERFGPLPGRPSWTLEEPLICFCGGRPEAWEGV